MHVWHGCASKNKYACVHKKNINAHDTRASKNRYACVLKRIIR
jgi:hypothetical protein